MKQGPRIYNLFPSLAGSVDRWIEHVPRIAAMQFNWIYLNPFHQTGNSGSLYAVKDYNRLNPLFRGRSQRADDDLIRAFVDRAAQAGIGVMMDLVINHTARDAELIATHPEWYRRDAEGNIESPSASDPADPANVTVWTDLAELDFRARPERDAMVAYFSEVIRHYAELGVRGFRCDAAYKVPAAVWATLIGSARRAAPGLVFAAENLGAPMETVCDLHPAGFDYLFNSAKWWDFRSPWLLEQYESFRGIAPSIAFPESHDTERLRTELGDASDAVIEAEYRFRYLFAATFSSGVMMPMGFEYGFQQKLDVVRTRPMHWEGALFDLSPFITSINAMKASIPALNEEGPAHALYRGGVAFALARTTNDGLERALTLLNPRVAEALSVDADTAFRAAGGIRLAEATPGQLGTTARDVELPPLTVRVFATEPPRPKFTDEGNLDAEASETARPCVIEAVAPQIDGGRHPVKRVVDQRCSVEADIFREGHDAVAAALLYRRTGAANWQETQMYPLGNDRWGGAFLLDGIGTYEYTVEAWPDAYESWAHDTALKYAAGASITLELIEGRALVAVAAQRSRDATRVALEAVLSAFDRAAPDSEKLAVLYSGSVSRLMEMAPDRSAATRYAHALPMIADRRAAEVGAWYELFPRSQSAHPGKRGSFTDAERQLQRIRELGFDVVYLPPIHPIGVSFRKGRNNSLDPEPGDPGSPWAIGNATGGHCAVEPSLGTLADFDHFVAAAQDLGLEIALDYALQCSPDHPYVREHPEWFSFRPDGTIRYAENPPKKYQDIVNFNWYGPHAPALWNELRDVVEFWIRHGVRIFRVDNPHTKPFAFWEWMIADVRGRHPGVLFLAEAFTRPKIMLELAKVGFTQSYTYFTWRNTKRELTEYLTELAAPPLADFYRPNFFANTPDILPPFLQTGGRPAFLIRLYLAATLSSLYGIYSGFELGENRALPGREEYADSEKYEIKQRDWNAPGNINEHIRTLNRIRRENPALSDWRNIRFFEADDDGVIAYMKTRGANTLVIVINLNPFQAKDVRIHLPPPELASADRTLKCENLISGERFTWRGPSVSIWLDPFVNPALIARVDTPSPISSEARA
jgi:starch synthase (maltosyl-transferring)